MSINVETPRLERLHRKHKRRVWRRKCRNEAKLSGVYIKPTPGQFGLILKHNQQN